MEKSNAKKIKYRQSVKGIQTELAYKIKNKDIIKEKLAIYRKENSEKIKESRKMYKSTHKENLREYYRNNKEKIKHNFYKRKYGITIEEYDKLLNEQKGCCAICFIKQKDIGRNLSIDHCHTTGKIRGLLCNNCNASIGLFKEDINILESAINYLKIHRI